MPNTKTKSQRIIERHRKLSRKCLGSTPFQDGEQRIWFTPGFDARDPNPGLNYGIRGVHFVFAKRVRRVAVTCEFLTDFYLTKQQQNPRIGMQPMCTGLAYHINDKELAEAEYQNKSSDCLFFEDEICYGGGSSYSYGDHIRDRLLDEGSVGVWDEIDKAIAEIETGAKQ